MSVKAIGIIKATAISGQPVDEGDTLVIGHDVDMDDAKALVQMKRAEHLEGDELAAVQKEHSKRKAKAEQEAKEKAEAEAKAKAEQGKQKEGKGNA